MPVSQNTHPPVLLPLGRKSSGKFAIIDYDDYTLAKTLKWHIEGKGYVVVVTNTFDLAGNPVRVRLDHYILNHVEKGYYVYFKNGNRLDFRKENLSLASLYRPGRPRGIEL